MKIRDIVAPIEAVAPLGWQASYDNAGLIVGRPDDEVDAVLLAVDVTEEVVAEAVAKGCGLIITHHPIIFHPLKRLNSASVVERCVEQAIRHGIALYACHTNLDSAPEGMSFRMAAWLGVQNPTLLEPADREATYGFGVVGELAEKRSTEDYLRFVKERLGCGAIRHSRIASSEVHRVAICTGAGASMIPLAQRAEADLYITADLKYNDFMAPERGLTVADVGHFESEYCAIEILFDILSKKICTFAVLRSEASSNPINYLV
ncbi:MAG: Nif3-like dinuclear metal center hexameric protein [Rikenellaceae bacterium]|nr:Nif3-like dinuclear metal center hexameric protein [Rikenellaceae bacterium]